MASYLIIIMHMFTVFDTHMWHVTLVKRDMAKKNFRWTRYPRRTVASLTREASAGRASLQSQWTMDDVSLLRWHGRFRAGRRAHVRLLRVNTGRYPIGCELSLIVARRNRHAVPARISRIAHHSERNTSTFLKQVVVTNKWIFVIESKSLSRL